MSTVSEHYNRVLADIYSWMFGGFDSGIAKNTEFFKNHQISPISSKIAVDIGAGCGFQSIPLAQLGFTVTAIDIEPKLLSELKNHGDKLPIVAIADDLINFEQYISDRPELIVCMTDTVLHLESKEQVILLLQKVFASLEEKGKFIITLRDLATELSELERFISVKSDAQRIFTCFLEYEPDTVKVHDLVYQKDGDNWQLNKSFYRKLRLSKQWLDEQIKSMGFAQVESDIDRGLITVIATK
jgi:precorrin-6B methylase 2